MRVLRRLWLVTFALFLFGAFAYADAQSSDVSTCPTLVQQALAAIHDNCAGIGRNTACYGFQDVQAAFTEATTPGFFSAPSDRAGLSTLKTIDASPMDTALHQWGIAMMSVQANLPNTLPGQSAVFMLMGDTQVESAVTSGDLFRGGAVVSVTTSIDAGLFYLPDAQSRVVGAIPANTPLSADAISADGGWVRVAFGDTPGWVTVGVLTSQDSLDTLPVYNPAQQSPMQAFYLRTGITGTECTQAPDALVVQGPQNLMIDINANGADIRLGSTIALRLVPLTDDLRAMFAPYYSDIDQVPALMVLYVIDGHATLNPGTPDEVNVDQGYYTVTCLSQTENLGLDQVSNDRQVVPGCPWLPPLPWTETIYEMFRALDGLDLNYVIQMPDELTPTPTPTPTNTFTAAPIYIPPAPTQTPTNTYTPVPIITATPTNTATVIPFDILTDTPTPTETEYEQTPDYQG